MQVSDKERQVSSETNFKELANMISDMCVNPDTKRPYSTTVIEKTLKDCHFTMKSNRSVKQHVIILKTLLLITFNFQALEAIPKLREHIKIDRAKMRLRIAIPSKDAKSLHTRIKNLFESVEVENWEEGAFDIVGLIDPGKYKVAEELIRKETKNEGALELLSLKVVNEGEIEIS